MMRTKWCRWGVVLACAWPAAAAAQENAADPQAFSLAPVGYVQFDVRTFPDWEVTPGSGRLDRDSVEVRRLRAGLDGRWKKLSFEFSVDPLDEDDTFVKDAFIDLRLSGRQRIRGGQFKLPGSREYGISARRGEFLERSALASQLAAGRDVGLMFAGRRGNVAYEAGVFAGDGQGRRDRAGTTAAARVGWEPLAGLEVGAYGSVGETTAVDTDAENGLDGRAPSGYRFFDGLYVQGRRLRFGGDVEWTEGPWRIAAEALRVTDERREQGVDFDDLPSVVGNSVTVTGSRRFGRPRDAAADPSTLGRTARWPWQVALRFEHVAFDDDGPRTGRDSVRPRASDVRARGLDAFTGGLSYQATRWLRLTGEAGVERYADARSAPDPGRAGNYFTAGLRLQFEFP